MFSIFIYEENLPKILLDYFINKMQLNCAKCVKLRIRIKRLFLYPFLFGFNVQD